MATLWHALYKGKLCRIRQTPGGGLITETWQEGVWVPGPNFAEFDFKGRMIFEDEAEEWIRSHFREKRIGRK